VVLIESISPAVWPQANSALVDLALVTCAFSRLESDLGGLQREGQDLFFAAHPGIGKLVPNQSAGLAGITSIGNLKEKIGYWMPSRRQIGVCNKGSRFIC
jgi:hypothetical protein